MAAEQPPREPGAQRKWRLLACVTTKGPLHGELWLLWYRDDTLLTGLERVVPASWLEDSTSSGVPEVEPVL